MEYTGERPTLDEGMSSSRMRYKEVIPMLTGKEVLDFGCGVGHGSYLLSHYAKRVIGYDINQTAVEEARQEFGDKENLSFTMDLKGSLREVDTVNMVEVFEHIEFEELNQLLSDISSTNKDLVLTTPYGDYFKYNPKTKEERRGFHVWHYTYDQLNEKLSQYFKYVSVTLGVWDPVLDGKGGPTGLIAYCSNKQIWKESVYSDPRCKELKDV
jgi:SAM-dependent methyltransferase